MKSIGIVCSDTFEGNALIQEAQLKFNKVIQINPLKVRFQFKRLNEFPEIIHDNEDLASLNYLLVRATQGKEKAISLLTHSLELCGTKIVDSVKRFPVGRASKLLTTVERFKNQSGISTYICFSKKPSILMLRDVANDFPLLTKPYAGKKSQDIIKVNNIDEAISFTNNFFSRSEKDEPILFQKYVNFVKEYRAFLVDGKVIGLVRKGKNRNNILTRRISKGKKVKNTPVSRFVEEKCNNNGILGVDVARDENGELYIIEANRSPQWENFQKITRTNTAEYIINNLLNENLTWNQ